MTNKIQNPSSNIPKTPEMNDRDFIDDCLTTEKYLTSSYSVALHEMSHQALYQDIMTLFNETEKCQRAIYDLMFQKGWYSVTAASPQTIQQTYQQFTHYATDQFSTSNIQ